MILYSDISPLWTEFLGYRERLELLEQKEALSRASASRSDSTSILMHYHCSIPFIMGLAHPAISFLAEQETLILRSGQSPQ